MSIFTNTNTFILGFVAPEAVVGLYVAAEKIYFALKSMQMPLHNVLYPYISKRKDIRFFFKTIMWGIILNTAICFLVYIYSIDIVNLFYGLQFINAYKILRIFCFVQLIVFPSIMIGYPLLGALGHTRTVNVTTIVAVILYLFSLFILGLIQKLNIYSVTYMVLFIETFIFAIRLYFVFKLNIISSYQCGKNSFDCNKN